MSLVNQMLRDLDARRQREQAAALQADVHAVAARRKSRQVPLLLGAAAILTAGAVYAAVAIAVQGTEAAPVISQRAASGASSPREAVLRPSLPASGAGGAVWLSNKAESDPDASAYGHSHASPSPDGRGATRTDDDAAHLATVEPTGTASAAPANKAATAVSSAKSVRAARHGAQVTDSHLRTSSSSMTKTPRPPTPAERAAGLYAEGVAAAQAGDAAAAEVKFRAALAADASAYGAREALASLLSRSGRAQAAMQLFVDGMRVDPAHQEEFSRLYARLLVARDRIPEAIAVLQQSLPAAADAPEHYAFLAALQERSGDHAQAAADYARALATRPDVGKWWAGLGIAYEQLRQPAKALKAYRRARQVGGLDIALLTYINKRVAALQP